MTHPALLSGEETRAPTRVSLRLTGAGRAALPIALVSLIVGWGIGGTAGLVAATTYALLALAPLTAWLAARRIRTGGPAPAQVFAGEAFVLPITIENRARFLTARDLVLSSSEERGSSGRPSGHAPELRGGERARVHIAHRLQDRGRTERLVLRVHSSWPLGLVRVELRFEHPVELIAFPRLGSLADLGRLPHGISAQVAERLRPRRGAEEFHGVREWREGESLRRVHWKLSARRGRTILREYQRRSDTPLELVLATCVEGPKVSNSRKRAFETAVSLAATLAEHHLRRERVVRLTLAGMHDARTFEGVGQVGLWQILMALALLEREEGAPLEALARASAAIRMRSVDCIAIAAARRRRPAVNAAAARGQVFLDVDDPACELVFQRGRSFGTRPPISRTRVG